MHTRGLASQPMHSVSLLINYEAYSSGLTSKLSRFMADLGSLIMSSSFLSRDSSLLSAPSDMVARPLLVSKKERITFFFFSFLNWWRFPKKKLTRGTSLSVANVRGPHQALGL